MGVHLRSRVGVFGDVERSDGSACGSVSILVESRRRDFRRLSRQGFSQSVTFRRGPPAAAHTTKSLHHRLKGRLHSPRSTQVLSTRKSHRQGVRVVAKGSSLVSPVWEWNWKLESLSTLSRLVSRSRERTDFLVHIRSTCVAVVSCTQLMYDHALKPRLTNLVSLSYLAARSHGLLLAQRCLLIPSIHGQRSSPLAAACQPPALGRRPLEATVVSSPRGASSSLPFMVKGRHRWQQPVNCRLWEGALRPLAQVPLSNKIREMVDLAPARIHGGLELGKITPC